MPVSLLRFILKMNTEKAVDHFEIDGSIGIKNEPGKLCLAKRKVTKGRGHVQYDSTEFFIYTVVYSRLNSRPAKIKINPDKMSFYRGHNTIAVFPKGEPGRKFVISTGVEDKKLVLLYNYLSTIRTGEEVSFE